MVKKCYYVENSAHALMMLCALVTMIPCFVDVKTFDNGSERGLEVDLIVRAEDVAFVERCFAPYV